MSVTLNNPIVISVSFDIEQQSFEFSGPKAFLIPGIRPKIRIPASDNPWPLQFKADAQASAGVTWTFQAISFCRQDSAGLPADSSWVTVDPSLVETSASSGYEVFQNLNNATAPMAGENQYRLAVTNFPSNATEVTVLNKNWNGGSSPFLIGCQLTILYPGPQPALFSSLDPQIQNEVDDGGTLTSGSQESS